MANNLLIMYYSRKGATEKMATAIGKGAKDAGANVTVKPVAECTMNDLLEADGIAFGSPTYYCNIAWQPKKFLDETILDFYTKGHSLKGKVCGCFTSVGALEDGKECLRMLEKAFSYALKMRMVSGLVLESKTVFQGELSKCYELGKALAEEIAKTN
ncbi:MAG: flavodoxin family protein [Methanocella sp.]|jgi:multimeric flavodoxin WrbA